MMRSSVFHADGGGDFVIYSVETASRVQRTHRRYVMAKRSGEECRVETLGCPVYGDKVTLSATYRIEESGDNRLVDFGCTKEGECGISAWDPCPMYVAYLEKRFSENAH
jgi:hypothetical protein